MDNDMQADELRQRMAQLRSTLAGDVYQMSESARAMADWRYYVRRFPLATTAAVAAVGYFVVPRRGTQSSRNVPDIGELLKENKIVGDGAATMKAGGMLNSLIAVAGAAALRMATALVAEKIRSSLQHHHQPESEAEDVPATSRPR